MLENAADRTGEIVVEEWAASVLAKNPNTVNPVYIGETLKEKADGKQRHNNANFEPKISTQEVQLVMGEWQAMDTKTPLGEGSTMLGRRKKRTQ